MNIERIRDDFPVTKTCVYLNTGFFGPISTPVVNAVKKYLDDSLRLGTGAYEVFSHALVEKEKAREQIAKIVGAAPNEISLTSRNTEGLNIAVRGLQWKKGDKIVINDLEYPPNMRLWNFLSRRLGVEIATVRAAEDGRVSPSDVEKKMDETTRLVAMCHVTFDTGLILPAKEIVKVAHERGALCLLDGAQAVGAIDVDVKEIGCDFYTIAGQKALCAGQGTGALYCRKELGNTLDPLIVGDPYTSSFVPGLQKVETFDVTSPDGEHLAPYKFEPTSLNYPGIISMRAAAEYLNALGPRNATARVRKLASMALETLVDIRKLKFLGSTDPERRIFASFIIEGKSNQDVTAKLLTEKKIATRALKKCVRACPHWINTESEISSLEEALREIVA